MATMQLIRHAYKKRMGVLLDPNQGLVVWACNDGKRTMECVHPSLFKKVRITEVSFVPGKNRHPFLFENLDGSYSIRFNPKHHWYILHYGQESSLPSVKKNSDGCIEVQFDRHFSLRLLDSHL